MPGWEAAKPKRFGGSEVRVKLQSLYLRYEFEKFYFFLRVPTFERVMVPYPSAGSWFLTMLPSCSKINIRRGNQET